MSGPVLVNGTIHLFRAACAGPLCKIFDDDSLDCRFNDVLYDDEDVNADPGDQGAGDVDPQDPQDPEPAQEPGNEPA